jgi:peptidoglycan/LPS O-acetylase OafA/YrhL
VAALIVVFDHFTRLWMETAHPAWAERLREFPLAIFTNGYGAVMMFFVLSGFVLTLPALGGKRQPYLVYALRRICRIYLPYLAAISLAILACWQFHGLQIYGHEFQVMWREGSPDTRTVLQHLLLVGRFDVFAYNPPAWTLVHELRISLLFPLLLLISSRLRGRWALAVAFCFPVLAGVMDRASLKLGLPGPAFESSRWITYAKTVEYCGVFLLGSLMARHQGVLRRWSGKMPDALKWLLLPVALLATQYPHRLPIPGHFFEFTMALGEAYILLLALMEHGWISRLLRRRPLRFLGRVSYSLYLLHLPLLMIFAIWIDGKLPFGLLLLPFLAVLLALSAVFYRFIEAPSMALGRRISAIRSLQIW